MTKPKFANVVTACALSAPFVAFLLVANVDGWDRAVMAPTAHFYTVSVATLLSAVIGTALALSVQSVRTTRSVFLALGFIALAMIFATHGLGTPGFIVPRGEYPYGVIISAGLSQAVCAIFVALSVLPTRWPGARFIREHGPGITIAMLALLAGYLLTMTMTPDFWRFIPVTRPWDTSLCVITLALLSFSAWRYFRAWRLTQLPGQMAMVGALVLLAEAQISMYFGTLWHLSWWEYHFLLLAAFSVLIAGWAVEAMRAKSLVVFSKAIELRDELDHVHSADAETLASLERAMADKDEYTHNHMGRVAEYAVAIGREMKLDARSLEVIETAGRIHDIGKITIPDAVLLKPGKLTDREFEQIKHHAAKGEHIARQSKVLAHVARVVRAHHERFAGNGYPDGLRGDQIPLEARIIAVADTFDALTSTRVYRPMRPWSEAVAELERVAGTQLDPACVRAFRSYLEKTGQLERGTDELAA